MTVKALDIKAIESVVASGQNFVSEEEFQGGCNVLFSYLNGVTITEACSLNSTSNFYVNAIYAVFRNASFISNLLTALRAERAFALSIPAEVGMGSSQFRREVLREGIGNKQFIHSALLFAFYPLVVVLPAFSRRNTTFIRKIISRNVESVQRSLKGEFTIGQTVDLLERVLFHVQFDSRRYMTPEREQPQARARTRTRLLGSLSILESTELAKLTDKVKYIVSERKRVGISLGHLNKVHGLITSYNIAHSEITARLLSEYVDKENLFVVKFLEDICDNNETAGFEFLKLFTDGKVLFSKGVGSDGKRRVDFGASILAWLTSSSKKSASLLALAQTNLKAFHGQLAEEDAEWSNKIYIICQKSLGVFSGIADAHDDIWKKKAFNREIGEWFENLYAILNRFEIEDDWSEIQLFIEEESDEIEWKSSFLTPIFGEIGTSQEQLLKLGTRVLLENGIVRTMIGMMNTKGGKIVVGLIEDPDLVVRPDFLQQIISKNGKSLFDIGFELSFHGMNWDKLKMKIHDILKNLTGISEDRFNDLWRLDSLNIKVENRSIEIGLISVSKSVEPIYHRRDGAWITLAKRANARTIFTLPV